MTDYVVAFAFTRAKGKVVIETRAFDLTEPISAVVDWHRGLKYPQIEIGHVILATDEVKDGEGTNKRMAK